MTSELLSQLPDERQLQQTQIGFSPEKKTWLTELIARLTSTPTPNLWILVSTFLAIRVFLLGSVALGAKVFTPLAIGLDLAAAGCIVVQLYAVYATGKTRFGIYYPLAMAVGNALIILPGIDNHFKLNASSALLALCGFFLIYLSVSLPIALLGAWRSLKQARSNKDNLTRQELLTRLLQTRDQFRTNLAGNENELNFDPEWVQKLRPKLWIFQIYALFPPVIGFVVAALFVDPSNQLMKIAQAAQADRQIGAMMAPILVFLFISIYWLTHNAIVAFIQRRISWALLSCAASQLAYAILIVIARSIFHPADFLWSVLDPMKFWSIFMLCGCSFGLFAFHIQTQIRRKNLIFEENPVALAAEILDLEWRLRPANTKVCVMVVDAAKSAMMKAEADPFEAEWSFREYQNFLAKIAGEFLGEVHATMGDGAVIGFPTASHAFQAAVRTQQEIPHFNQMVNRLKHPFRLRVGLHQGEVQGDLGEVQFTDVIDIAAHIEGASVIGGIAFSEPIRAELTDVFSEPAGEVDGFSIFQWKQAEFKL